MKFKKIMSQIISHFFDPNELNVLYFFNFISKSHITPVPKPPLLD